MDRRHPIFADARIERLEAALRACMQDTLYYTEVCCEEGSQGKAEGQARLDAALKALAVASAGEPANPPKSCAQFRS